MSELFDRFGEQTRLSDAQYRKLHALLKLDKVAPKETPANPANAPSSASPRPTNAKPKAYRRQKRSVSPRRRFRPRIVPSPFRAISRAQRAMMLPVLLLLGVAGIIGALFGNDGAHSPSQAFEASGSTYRWVTGNVVNQRKGPGTQYEVIGQLSKGTRVRFLQEQGTWTEVWSTHGLGWMSSRYLSSNAAQIETSAGQSSNTRELQASDIRVIDGDTLDIARQSANVRLVGFNAPEVGSPKCSNELAMGRRATDRLRALIRSANSIELTRVRCACAPGTQGTSRCNFGRQCGVLKLDGRDVGKILISEGLAASYICGRTSCPPRTGNWCN
jgi:endonuclease YncB( thermonuclease family)